MVSDSNLYKSIWDNWIAFPAHSSLFISPSVIMRREDLIYSQHIRSKSYKWYKCMSTFKRHHLVDCLKIQGKCLSSSKVQVKQEREEAKWLLHRRRTALLWTRLTKRLRAAATRPPSSFASGAALPRVLHPFHTIKLHLLPSGIATTPRLDGHIQACNQVIHHTVLALWMLIQRLLFTLKWLVFCTMAGSSRYTPLGSEE